MGLRASFLAKTAARARRARAGTSICRAGATGPTRSRGHDARMRSAAVVRSAIAGVLEHLPAASLLLNPTINSYKRLVPGWFAPVNVSWGLENRSCAVRAIRGERPELWRIECRRPGADANPYLALAAVVASAADGIRRGAAPPRADRGRRLRARRPAGAARVARECAARVRRRRCPAGRRSASVQRLLRDLARVGAEGLARDRDRLGARALRARRLRR